MTLSELLDGFGPYCRFKFGKDDSQFRSLDEIRAMMRADGRMDFEKFVLKQCPEWSPGWWVVQDFTATPPMPLFYYFD